MMAGMKDLATIRWEAVQRRDARMDGVFVYAVRTTGVYCRPRCSARRPRPDNVEYFTTPMEAESAGYRACQRCHPDQGREADPVVTAIVEVCRWFEASDDGRTIAEVARQFGWSDRHLRRLFQSVLGVSIGSYRRAVRQAVLRTALRGEASVARAIYEAGYGSAQAFYDDGAPRLAMPVRSYQAGGSGQALRYTAFPTAVGHVLAAATERGVAVVYIGEHEGDLVSRLHREYPAAKVCRDDARLQGIARTIQHATRGQGDPGQVPVDLRGTAFQARVWDALRRIPSGSTRSYGDVAKAIGAPSSARAVAQACARNPAAILVPCHRVIGQDGQLGGYRWGRAIKRALLAAEAHPTVDRTRHDSPQAIGSEHAEGVEHEEETHEEETHE